MATIATTLVDLVLGTYRGSAHSGWTLRDASTPFAPLAAIHDPVVKSDETASCVLATDMVQVAKLATSLTVENAGFPGFLSPI